VTSTRAAFPRAGFILGDPDTLRLAPTHRTACFAMVFVLGFVLGTARTLIVQAAPGGGQLLGVLVELPIMVGASWFWSGIVVRGFAVAPTIAARAVMGGLAFALMPVIQLRLGESPGR
jgi:hypothetical protein